MDRWVVAKLIGYKKVYCKVVLKVFWSIWGSRRLEDSRMFRTNMFLFKFNTLDDKMAIMRRTPWSFDGNVLALAHYDPTLSLEEYDFVPLAIWSATNSDKTIAVDMRSGEGRMGDYLQVRVEIDNTKPLRRCFKMGKMANGQPRRCLLKYECLPSFCHWCDIIGHVLTECPSYSVQLQQPLQYGEWIRMALTRSTEESSRTRRKGVSSNPNPDDKINSTNSDSVPPYVCIVRDLTREEENRHNPNPSVRPEVGSSSSGKCKGGDNDKGKKNEEEDPSEPVSEQPGDVFLMVKAEELRRLISNKNPLLVFVSETKIKKNKVESITLTTQMHGYFLVDRSDDCVGLLLLWKKGLTVSLRSFSNLHIDVEIKKSGDKLRRWQRMRQSQAKRDERQLRDQILQLDSAPVLDLVCEQCFETMDELKEIIDKDEAYWLQRSRVAWLRDGDKNTTFFHARANGRRKKNWIEGIEPDEEILQVIDCWDNELLYRNFTSEEGIHAFSQVNPSKAPGIDGLSGMRISDNFLVAHELIYYLKALLLEVQRRNDIKGIRTSFRGPRISYLLYADNSILFVNNSMEELRKIKSILLKYERASGQKWEKVRDEPPISSKIRLLKEFKGGPRHFFPSEAVKFLSSRSFKRSQRMPCPATCCRKVLLRILRSKQDCIDGRESKNPEVGLCLIGIRLIHDEDSLAFKVLKAKYFPLSNFLEAKLGDIYSYVWVSILKAKDALLEALPTGEKLKQARLGDGICSLCNVLVELALHAVKDYPKSKSILSLSGLPQDIVDWEGTSCFDWFTSMFPKLNREGFDLFLTLLWNVWNRRNKWIHDVELQTDRDVILKAWNLLAFCHESQKVTVGIVAHDSNGMVLGGMTKQIDHPNSAESTEAFAFTQGIRLTVENGWSNVLIEGDAILVGNRLSN
ncbi:hypothetical protein F3Y22_tig00117034pilonHSYRG01593 [Hibiscus syriacus]|uniref:DUF4283 domain-containing protein n=1 Tax=Hibiscus syriacus TaxID=106335 RepID=A0A6A2WDJ9_HIBSY|nr:hypothetical protein F3Y22_tig00117034pilonHSYRG01593 [Hibiscus syriacus]